MNKRTDGKTLSALAKQNVQDDALGSHAPRFFLELNDPRGVLVSYRKLTILIMSRDHN